MPRSRAESFALLLSTIGIAGLGAGVVASCGGDDLVLPGDGTAVRLVALKGEGQTATVGQPLPDSLVVRVLDRNGEPVAGAAVRWSATGGGTVSPAEAATDSGGRAAASRVLGTAAGLHATVASVAPDLTLTFTSTAVPVTTPQLRLVTPPSPAAASGVPLAQQPVVQVVDPSGTPLAQAGLLVTVAIATGGGALSGGTTRETDAAGRAAFTDLAIGGPPGPRTLIFAAPDVASVTSTPVELQAGAVSEERSSVSVAPATITASDGASAAILMVTAADVSGFPVPGAEIVLEVAGGASTVKPATAVTGPDGTARLELSSTATGTRTVTVRAGGVTLRQRPEIVVVPGAPSAARSSASAGAGRAGTPTTVRVESRDAYGNRVGQGGAAVAVSVSGANAAAPAVTDLRDGTYSAVYVPLRAGSDRIAVRLNGAPLSGEVTSVVSPGPAAAAATTADVPAGILGRPTVVTVTTHDAYGNRLTSGGAPIRVLVSNTELTVTDRHDGSYQASFTVFFPGVYRVWVLYADQPIPGSPFDSVQEFP